MSKIRIGIPSDKIVVNTLSTYITDFFTFLRIESSCLIFIGILNRIRCAVIRVKIYCVFTVTPFSVKRNVVPRHLVKCIRIASAKLIIIPSEEYISAKCRLYIVVTGIDISFVVNIALCSKVRTSCRCIGYRIPTAIYEYSVTVSDVVLFTSVTKVNIVICSTPTTT